MSRKKVLPTGLTDAHFYDVAAFELQADPHRVYLGFELYDGARFFLHIVHTGQGFYVLLDQERTKCASSL